MKSRNDDSDDRLHQILRSMPERFAIAKTGVNASTQQEYLAFTANVEREPYSEEDIPARSEALFKSTTSTEEKKHILARLAHTGTLDAYRILEQFAETAEPELQGWGTLALHECRLLLEQARVEPVGGAVAWHQEIQRFRLYYGEVCSEGRA